MESLRELFRYIPNEIDEWNLILRKLENYIRCNISKIFYFLLDRKSVLGFPRFILIYLFMFPNS